MDTILQFLLGNAVVATLLAIPAAASTWLFRRPALSHALWTLVLLKLVTPPLIHVSTPAYTGLRAANTEGTPQGQPLSTKLTDGVDTSRAAPVSPSASSPNEPQTEHLTFSPPDDSQSALSEGLHAWTKTVFWVEVVGGLAWLTWAALRIRRFHRMLASAGPAPTELVRDVERWASRIGLKRCPNVLAWRRIAPPIVFVLGRKATLILPVELVAQLNGEQLASVLIHELAHLRRGDHWVRFLELAVTAVYWWHPVVWWAKRELERTEEQACDAWVLWAAPHVGPSYAGA